jgi:multiple antibiotic resistance protein
VRQGGTVGIWTLSTKGRTVDVEAFLSNFVKALVPIFFAVDAIGVLPIFMGLTEGIERKQRQRIVRQSLLTALLVAGGFILLGKTVFGLLGITIADFEMAGGAMLFLIAALDLVRAEKTRAEGVETIGAVPLGTPLIIGPATLTMALILVDLCGLYETLLAVVVNIAVAGLVFMSADFFTRLLGKPGSRAVSKVASLILAAIAVMMIRKGLLETFPFLGK